MIKEKDEMEFYRLMKQLPSLDVGFCPSPELIKSVNDALKELVSRTPRKPRFLGDWPVSTH